MLTFVLMSTRCSSRCLTVFSKPTSAWTWRYILKNKNAHRILRTTRDELMVFKITKCFNSSNRLVYFPTDKKKILLVYCLHALNLSNIARNIVQIMQLIFDNNTKLRIIVMFTSVIVTVVCKSLPSLLKRSWAAVRIRNCSKYHI